ncbi:MAG TPA: ABC transporter permease [Vicinamibacterales bacterium]
MSLDRWWHVARMRLRSLFRSARVEDELAEEVRTHIEARRQQLKANGLGDAEAHAAAIRAFGGVEQRKEECRDTRRTRVLEDLVRDAAYAARMLRRNPGFATVAVLSLGIGIGANTAMFGVLDVLTLRKLPVAEPDRLVLVDTSFGVSFDQFGRLRELSNAFTNLAAIWTIDRFNIVVERRVGDAAGVQSEAPQARIGLASADYFQAMGLVPAIGRPFVAADDRAAGAASVAIISDAFWRRAFGRATDVVGRALTLNGVKYTVIGVTPAGFTGEWVGMPTDVWVPFSMASLVMPEVPGGPTRFPRRVVARLKPGATRAQAQAATETLFHQILKEESGANLTADVLDQIAKQRLTLKPAAKGYSPQRESFAQPLAILATAVGVLLLIACANLANLLLARSAGRQREMAVRLAIGAGRGRLVRQLLTESLVLSSIAGGVGAAFAILAGQAISTMVAASPVNMGGQGSQLVLDLALNVRVLAFAAAVCLVTGVLFGLAPAVSASRAPVAASLTNASTRLIGTWRSFGPSTVLVVAQVGLSLLLLIGAALFARTLANLKAKDLGMEREHMLLVWTVPGQTGRQDAAMANFWHDVQERLSAIPGVTSAAASNQSVLNGFVVQPGAPSMPMRVQGEPPKPTTFGGFRSFITPRFFSTIGVPFLAGRDFTEQDTEGAPRVTILNETMARFYFGDRNPIGRIVQFAGTPIPTEIVGVTRDWVKGTPRAGAQGEFATYFPYRDREALNRGAQTRLRVMLVVLRTTVEPMTLATTVRRELRAVDPAVPILRINTTEQQLDDVLAQEWLVAVLSAALGGIAVILACLGIFGLVSYRVARRTNEIGLRIALGATRGSMLGMILTESGRLVVIGLVVGLAAALAAGRAIAARLYGVSASDPWTIAAAMALLVIVAALAAFIPARRASLVEPTVALRTE